jgi:hypothetical protein
MSIATTSDFETAPAHPLAMPLILAIGCVALADWLFYSWDIGISLALFLGVLGAVTVASNRVQASRKTQIVMGAVFLAGLLALVENVNWLSSIWAGLATAAFAIVMTARDEASWQQHLLEAVILPVLGPFRFVNDVIWQSWQTLRRDHDWLRLDSLIGWIVPLGIFAIFLALLGSANPLIERGLLQIDVRAMLDLLSPRRIAFWLLLAGVIWPFLFRRSFRNPIPAIALDRDAASVASSVNYLLGTQATLRSMILFNALFALQTTLDLTYLWGGAALPDGMSHAEYAHRGAYPLIVTALLAAGFVLIAMRPGGPAEQSRLIRPLVLIWIAQNILLVISSIFRLDLYIAAFSLTYLRLTAFIWMGLVATGLLLILIQITRRKSNSWLLSTNAIALALVLYGCCFLNAPWLVATYNVEHCREVSGVGPALDMKYLASLGSAQTLPPVEAHMKQFPEIMPLSLAYRESSDRDYFKLPGNWRAWGFRRWRLERYFAKTPAERLISPDSSKG